MIDLKKYDEAIMPLQMVQALAFTNDLLKTQMNTHKSLAIAFERQGNLKKAIVQQKGYANAKERYLLNLSIAKRLEVSQELIKAENLLKDENEVLKTKILKLIQQRNNIATQDKKGKTLFKS